MLREYRSCGGCRHLTDISMQLSKEINSLADRLHEILRRESPDFETDPALSELLMSYCPPVLVERYRDRILSQVPRQHLYALVSAFIASRIVYAEGVGWLKGLASIRELDTVVRTYLRQEKKLAGYMAALRESGADSDGEIRRILEAAGKKFLTSEDLGLE